MPRIAGIDIPERKRVDIALTAIYGIGRPLAHAIVHTARIDPAKHASALNAEEVARLRDIIEKNYKIEGELRRAIMMNIKHLRDIECYRGTRHKRGLPVRGQRTKTNSRTRRGNVRRTMGSGKRTLEKK